MSKYRLIIKPISLNTLIIYFEQHISQEVLNQVVQMTTQLKLLEGIVDIIPSYCSILVTYNIKIYNYETIQKTIWNCLESETLAPNKATPNSPNIIKIPTDYSKNLDLKRVADHNHLTIEEVITLHTQEVYRVYAIGFMVGFAYLAQVPTKIATPRLSTPRAKIPKGSVAIADRQTAIYPQDSAGGWNIIGTTPFNNFEQFSIGDYVQFTRLNSGI